MEQLIRQFGTWLKQGFGWLIDVFVYGCVWGISQISRLLGVHVGASADSLIALVIALLLIILLIWLFYSVIWRFVGLIRWALEQVAYAIGVLLMLLVGVSGLLTGVGLVVGIVFVVMSMVSL